MIFICQDQYAPASQCFLTGTAMFVLCWKITNDPDNGVSKLRDWLLKIQVCVYSHYMCRVVCYVHAGLLLVVFIC